MSDEDSYRQGCPVMVSRHAEPPEGFPTTEWIALDDD